MIGVIVNTLAVIIGSLVGLLCKKGIPEKLINAVMIGLGLCTLYIGISGALKGENAIATIISMVLGAIIGTLLDLDDKIAKIGNLLENKLEKMTTGNVSISEGFVTGSLLFCVGAMTIVGSLNAGLAGDNEMLFTKSILDLISSVMLSVSLGLGVLLSSVFVFVFQGSIVVLAGYLQPILTHTAILELTCVGSLMIIALGLNILGITKIKVANYLPALVFAPLVSLVCNLFM